jgi:hypothetical protein
VVGFRACSGFLCVVDDVCCMGWFFADLGAAALDLRLDSASRCVVYIRRFT